MEAQLGARHPDTLISVNNLGALLLDGGKVDESEVLLRRAVEGLEAQLGSQHPGTLRSVYHLARLRVAQGRLEDAESHFRRAMEGQVAQLGVRHQQTLDSISRLANLLEAKGSMEEASLGAPNISSSIFSQSHVSLLHRFPLDPFWEETWT